MDLMEGAQAESRLQPFNISILQAFSLTAH